MRQFFHSIAKKKKIDGPSFLHLLADGQLLIYAADAKSTSLYIVGCRGASQLGDPWKGGPPRV